MKIKNLLTIITETTMMKSLRERKSKMTTESKNSLWNDLKKWFRSWWQAALAGFFLGVAVTNYYAFNNLINDCKVIGAFRIGNVAFGCQMSKV